MKLKILLAISLVVNVELAVAVTFLLKQNPVMPDTTTPIILYRMHQTDTNTAMVETSTNAAPIPSP